MYAQPQSFDNLVRDLTEAAGSKQNARTLVYVELTLFLARSLGLDSEPLTIGWVLLSRLPLHHPLLNTLSLKQRQMRAKAAIIVPLSSRFAWESALVQYEKDITSDIRLYRIHNPQRLDEQMLDVCRQQPCPDPLREERYETILSQQLSWVERPQRHTVPGETYRVQIKAADGIMRYGHVEIAEATQPLQSGDSQWFDTPRPRTVITIGLHELLPTAQFLDEYERRTGGRMHWVHDLKHIRFRKATYTDNQLTLEPENKHPLDLEGAVHLPGMVSAGKTTLAKLIIAHCIRLSWDIRITLVVGDSHTAIEIAHQVNSWFYDDPAGDAVIAVPILGATQRETHLRRLLESREYKRSLQTGRPHWGERWLMPACPLASQIRWEGEQDVIILAGSEPCESLLDEPNSRHSKRHICPLFSGCPAKQIYRDMPQAQLWVITPGALSQAALPLHLDQRIAKMGDLVYEQSDLVIFDEVETIVDWFDRTFAQKADLTNGKDGLLDRLDTQNALAWSANRIMPSNQRRWVMAMRDSLKALSGVLTAITNPAQERMVKKWVSHGHFAPNQLAYRLARRLAGLKEWDSADTPIEMRRQNEAQTKATFESFDQLLNQTPDPLRLQIPPAPGEVNKVGELARLMQSINNLADDGAGEDIFTQSRDWILRWYPEIRERLAALRQQLEQSDDPFDRAYLEDQFDRSIDELAQRLQFMLTVALLDRHMHIVLQEWHNKPETLDAQQPFSRIPRGMRNILPLPLTGQQYGFASDMTRTAHSTEAANRLSMFMYTNIGRSYILNFHRLREDIDGFPGPHVLALSGTSYLPDSTPFHVTLLPAGVLMPPAQTEAAIQGSRFIWQPFADKRGRPISISGRQDKERQLRLLMKAMLDYSGMPGGFIGKVLAWLETQATDSPEQWGDRARVLLLTNSYSQAKAAAQILRAGWPDAAGTIFNLKRGGRDEDYEVEFEQQGTLRRIDIEQFAGTGGRILLAPMQSIGRGFNILNDANEPKAAFGAIFFLTRPMNPPYDIAANAQELNRYALQWADDPAFPAWAEDTLYRRALNARESAMELRRMIEHRRSYSHLDDDARLGVYPRRDLAATTAGRIVQAVGRLLRGGVPFRAYFIDAAWSPQLARSGDANGSESEDTSLLTAVINIMNAYAQQDEIGQQLYGSLSEALITTENRDSN